MPVLSGAVHVGDPIRTSLVQVDLDEAGFTTGHTQRDTAVRGPRYLDSDAHPTLTFAADGPARRAGGWTARSPSAA